MDSLPRQEKGSYTLNRAEALRYMGYAGQELDAALSDRIEELSVYCENVSQPAWIYRIFPVRVESNGINLEGCTLALKGNDIYNHLHEARYCAVMAATCGLTNERELIKMRALGGVDALIFDAAGSALVEAAGNACNAAIVAHAHEAGLFTNYRYGPGYGDLGLDIQGELLRVLGADNKLGMRVTGSHMLVPTKSITAFVGLFDEVQESRPTCKNCSLRASCTLREKGQRCYR